MNTLDIIILVPLLYGLVRGLMKGLVGEVTSIIAVGAAVMCAKLFASDCALVIMQYLSISEPVAQTTAYVLVFFVVAVVLNLVGRLFARLLKAISLGWLNRLLGAVFGTLKWALLVSVLLNGVALLDDYVHIIKPDLKQTSVMYEPMKQIASVAWEQAKNIQEENSI